MGVLQPTETGVLIRVRVQPRASVAGVAGIYGDRLRLRVMSPPVEGAANTACIALLAKALGVRRSPVQLHAGEKSRDKLLHISGLSVAQIATILGIS